MRRVLKTRESYLILLVCIFGVLANQSSNVWSDISVSGTNQFNLARGFKNINDTTSVTKWNYTTDILDVNINIKKFYLNTRFQIDEPSMGYNPSPAVYREFFSRRSIGFSGDNLNLRVGHFKDVFGRGLSLNLDESLETESVNILDGVSLVSDLSLLSIKAFTGRPLDNKIQFADLKSNNIDNQGNQLSIKNAFDDYFFGSTISGAYLNIFPQFELPVASWINSLGGGFVFFQTDVSNEKNGTKINSISTNETTGLPDTSFGYISYRNRTNTVLPSFQIDISTPIIDFYAEHSELLYYRHEYVDSLFDEKIINESRGYATYTSLSASISDVYLLLEYKDYFYSRAFNPGGKIVSSYVEPPCVRYEHSWKLLTKHIPASLTDDVIGGNLIVTISHFDPTIFQFAINGGGKHRDTSFSSIEYLLPKSEDYYWEIYLQWDQVITNKIKLKTGVDYGLLDPDLPDNKYATIGIKTDLGPFFKNSNIGLDLEYQYGSKKFLAEKDSSSVRKIASEYSTTNIPQDEDAFFYYSKVPDIYKTKYIQYGNNFASSVSYTFSSLFTVVASFEYETILSRQESTLQDNLTKDINIYKSLGVSINPFDNHTVKIEVGSFSGGQVCSYGTCVTVPPFKGFKMSFLSNF